MNSLLLPILVVGVFVLSFGVVLYFIRSSRIEAALQRQLEMVSEGYRGRATSTTILKEDRYSPSPQLHELLTQTPVAAPILRLIKQAGAQWWVSSVLGYSFLLALGGALLAAIFLKSWPLILGFAVIAALSPLGYLRILRQGRFKACSRLLPDAVDLMARGLRAGHSLNAALEMVSTDVGDPLASEFRTVSEEQALGLPLRDAMDNLLQRIPNADLEFLVAALLLQKDTGGNLAQILDKTSALMRDRVRLRGEVRSRTAQARASGWVLGAIPFVMFLLMSLLNPGYESILINDPIGIKLIYTGLVMLAVGVMVIRKIVDIQL